MSDKMVLLAIYGNPIEAELARAELQGQGIRACVMGATSGDVFAGLGVGMSNVQLLVPEADYERATELLAEESDVAQEARENWEREEEPDTAIQPADLSATDATDIRPAIQSPLRTESNPVPPAPSGNGAETESELASHFPEEEEDRDERPLTWTPDDIAARAFRAALFGYFTCGVLHLYALYLIVRLAFVEGDLTPAGAQGLCRRDPCPVAVRRLHRARLGNPPLAAFFRPPGSPKRQRGKRIRRWRVGLPAHRLANRKAPSYLPL